MIKTVIFLGLFVLINLFLTAQRSFIDLTFTANNNGMYVQLDSIKIMDITRSCDTVLHWPDTVFSLGYVGLPSHPQPEKYFHLSQNYPNPVINETNFDVIIPLKGKLDLLVIDPMGRILISFSKEMENGVYQFHFTPGNSSLYFISAVFNGETSSIKVLHPFSSSDYNCDLQYSGTNLVAPPLKVIQEQTDECFIVGDELLYIGYSGGYNSGFLDTLVSTASYSFQFATNIPCPDLPTVTYEGQVYNTVQIFSQCWLKENLNVGVMITADQDQTDNGIIEKYCYNNEPDSCTKYGGLYQWYELMQYIIYQNETQGICPEGWHIPSDLECKILEGAVDSHYGIGDPEWDEYQARGFDAGLNLKSATGWAQNGNGTDLFGFTVLPGGSVWQNSFNEITVRGGWATSTYTPGEMVLKRSVLFNLEKIANTANDRLAGGSVRCVKDF
jgi:uncharacterized protein (TIGR02145 family)